ncbi:alkaline phosphatase family protein [Alloacidobacterium sp.]|uniref:alkaline phosphatase family protein n=1 Tax=Alloacidobacterium sp. TaxID=2951999 RepID=UPI002D626FDE|nr:alkaline phosphatase family protein [Alloacidobacterium sp.]HYK37849.1 alkaline phosphatase family protein [Alloacidobacterium sp.]
MARILSQIDHVVVVMFENRSFDTIFGWLYANGAQQPTQYLPSSPNPKPFDGLNHNLFNPQTAAYFNGQDQDKIWGPFDKATSTVNPNPDPLEDFANVNYQLFGPEEPNQNPRWPNLGFVVNYALQTGPNIPVEMMEAYSPDQVPVLSALARNYAVSDAWFCSVPSDTWPNRSFVHAGTSNGNVVNGTYPNPFDWNVRTIFNVLEDTGASWKVYSNTVITPALTGLMFPELWQYSLDRFAHFDDFRQACSDGALPQYSFLEPSFLDNPDDYHPPHDVVAGEKFLYEIWQAVSKSPKWKQTLLIITFDEHGGTYDHVMPPWNAACPDEESNPGQLGFTFNRFGVRVPTVVVSPWIQAGTVFRSNTATPYDHTSVLATLRDRLEIPGEKMLTSKRIEAAPTLAQVLNLAEVRDDLPDISPPPAETQQTGTFLPPNELQKTLISAQAVQQNQDPQKTLAQMGTRQQAIEFFQRQAQARQEGPSHK